MLATENKPGAQYLMVLKAVSMLAQVFLVIVILITQEEHIYETIDTDNEPGSTAFVEKAAEISVCAGVFLFFLGIEFLMLLTGISVMFLRITAFQISFHFTGAVLLLWIILDRFNYFWYLMVFTGALPFALEFVATAYACLIHRMKKKYRLQPGSINELTREEVERKKFLAWRKMKEERKLKREAGGGTDRKDGETRGNPEEERRDTPGRTPGQTPDGSRDDGPRITPDNSPRPDDEPRELVE